MRHKTLTFLGIAILCCTSCNNQRVPTFSPEMTDYTNSIGMKFKRIEAGAFMMGPAPGEMMTDPHEVPHQVQISKPFFIGQFEVTQEQYRRVMQNNPSFFQKGEEGNIYTVGLNTDDFPVENVNYFDALEFCKRLNQLEAGAKFRYRLPTEAEWEYACRAGTTTAFHFGEELVNAEQANCRGHINYPPNIEPDGNGKFLNRTSTVGSYQPNAWGLFDMSGNVFEWVSDWYTQDFGFRKDENGKLIIPELTVDPQGPQLSETATEEEKRQFADKYVKKIVRGGSWGFPPGSCRSSNRKNQDPDHRRSATGFRVVLVPEDAG